MTKVKTPKKKARGKAPPLLDEDLRWFVAFIAGCSAFPDDGLVAGFVTDARSHLHFTSSLGAFRKIAAELKRVGY